MLEICKSGSVRVEPREGLLYSTKSDKDHMVLKKKAAVPVEPVAILGHPSHKRTLFFDVHPYRDMIK